MKDVADLLWDVIRDMEIKSIIDVGTGVNGVVGLHYLELKNIQINGLIRVNPLNLKTFQKM